MVDVLPGGKLSVHWWSSKKLDGTWAPEYRQPEGGKQVKGTAGPYLGSIEKASVMDRIPALAGKKKGKIPAAQLRELIKFSSLI